MSHDLILLEDDFHRLNVSLTKLIDKARLDCALLINKSGRMLTSQSESGDIDKTALSALVVGSFVSTTNIANMLGETEFTSMYHQGSRKHIRVSLVDENTLLTVIFDNRTTLEKVKQYTKQASEELRETLSVAYSHIETNPEINLDVTPKSPMMASADGAAASRDTRAENDFAQDFPQGADLMDLEFLNPKGDD